MNREIKFRVWDNVNYMSNPFTLRDIMQGRIEFTSDCPIMQYTGLKDRHGKEIYESDIVRIGTDLRVVEWHIIGLRVKSLKHEWNFPLHYPFVKGEKTDWEVVGNVYEMGKAEKVKCEHDFVFVGSVGDAHCSKCNSWQGL